MKLLREAIKKLLLENRMGFSIANQMITLTADANEIEYDFERRRNGAIYSFKTYEDLGVIIKEVLAGEVAFEPYTPFDYIDALSDPEGYPGYRSDLSDDNYKLFLFEKI